MTKQHKKVPNEQGAYTWEGLKQGEDASVVAISGKYMVEAYGDFGGNKLDLLFGFDANRMKPIEGGKTDFFAIIEVASGSFKPYLEDDKDAKVTVTIKKMGA